MEKGVKFTMEPTEMGEVTIAVFDDTCGNLIQIVQKQLHDQLRTALYG